MGLFEISYFAFSQLLLVSGNESLSNHLRAMASIEIAQNIIYFSRHPKYLNGITESNFSAGTLYSVGLRDPAHQHWLHLDNLESSLRAKLAVKTETADACNLNEWASLTQMLALNSVIGLPIY